MKYWKEIELPGWETAAEKIYKWMLWDKRILNGRFFWNTVDPRVVTRVVAPELGKALDALGVQCEYAALITAYAENSESVHVDNMSFENGVVCRLNIPIRNTEGSYTAFYTTSDNFLERHIMPNKLVGWLVDPKKCVEASRVEMTKPTVIRIGVPHAVHINKNAAQPRITLTMRLNKDPVQWLEDDDANI